MEFVLNKLPRGQAKKIRWSSSKDGQTMCACAHFICLPPFLPADFKEQAGRIHNRIVEDTEISSLKISLEISGKGRATRPHQHPFSLEIAQSLLLKDTRIGHQNKLVRT
jgi:hypothetical protein